MSHSSAGPGADRPKPKALSERWGLRARVLLLVVLTTLPAFGLLTYAGVQERSHSLSETRASVVRLVQTVAAVHERRIDESRVFLEALAHFPTVRDAGPECPATLRDFLRANPNYRNLGVIGSDGVVVCSAVPFTAPTSAADRSYFRRAVATKHFAVGDYMVGRITHAATLNFGLPILDPTGRVRAVLFAALDLAYLKDPEGFDIPPDGIVTVIDSVGTVLAQEPDHGGWNGRSIAGFSLFRALLTATGASTIQTAGPDGIPRLYGLAVVRTHTGESPVFIAIGIPLVTVFRNADAESRNSFLLLALAGLMLAVAWVFSTTGLLRPLDRLTAVARRLGRGDLSARVTPGEMPRELQVLADAVNEMASMVEQRAKAEEARAQLAAIVEAADEAILSVTGDGTILSWNSGAERVYGYSREDIVGRSVSVLAPPDRAGESAEIVERLVKGGPTEHIETVRLKKDGTRVDVSLTVSPIQDRSGRVVGVSGIGRDVTAQRRAERTVLESELRYRSLFEGVPVGLYQATAAGKILDVNPAFLQMLGYADRESLRAVNAATLYVDPTVRGQFSSLLEREGVVTDFESQLRRRDGTVIWVRANARALRDKHGRVVHHEGAIIDITQRKQAEEETRHRVTELEAFYEISRRLRGADNQEDMYSILVDHAMRLLRADHGTLALVDLEHRAFRRVYAAGRPREELGSTFPVGGSPSGRVLETGEAWTTDDHARTMAAGMMAENSRYRSLGPLLIVPVRSEREIIGTLGLGRLNGEDARAFTDEEVRLVEGIAEIGGTAIRRARLRSHLEQSYIQIVVSLARTLDAHDAYTGGHSERLSAWAEEMARALGCSVEEIADIRSAALLHDIGKIGVSDTILLKPGPLTGAEWTEIRKHPVIGERILLPVEHMKGVARLVRSHQERWDGRGFPDGLRGEGVPLGARILAVVDAYSAIVDDRPYRKGRSSEEALAELQRCAGTMFDPKMVRTFTELLGREGVSSDVALAPEADASPSSPQPSWRTVPEGRRADRPLPAMVEVAERLLRPMDLTAVLEEILSQIQGLFGYPICGIFLVDQDAHELYVKAQRGYDPEIAKIMRLRIGSQGIAGWVALTGAPYYAPDVRRDPLYYQGVPTARSNVAFPLAVNEAVIGVLDVESPEVDAFPEETRDILTVFAALAALAILRAQRDEELHRLALTDYLTGLPNHRALREALEREMARGARYTHSLALVFVEIDKFKQLNDRYGHLAGDAILRSVAAVLKKSCRTMDLVARVGGDEFVLMLPQTPREVAEQVAERLRGQIEAGVVPGGAHLTVSVGVASMPDGVTDAEALIEAADRAMYRVKRAGGNRVGVA